MHRAGLVGLVGLAAACSTARVDETTTPTAMRDIHSRAEPTAVRSRHLQLELTLDFEAHVARGRVTHLLDRPDPAAPLRLDQHGVVVRRVTDQTGAELTHREIAPGDDLLGAGLEVDLASDTNAVTVEYETQPTAESMQWLAPEQTNGGTQPFLFTQGQAILTRTWIPVQDSPAVRTTWEARVTAPKPLTVLMSADVRGRDGDAFTFAMTKPVPSYLIALACGDLVARDVSARCAVHAEPSTIELAANEFADMERMVQACEELFGPYRWGRYDVLVLPPSFPFGGMENPCLTFATPTILAGDRSLVSLIAHELAHSWSGNLVTNATWRDFWLNEGFTVYLERRIMEHVYGKDRAAMENALGMQELRDELARLPEPDQVLHVDLAGRNPDDGMTNVPYEKGAALLRRIEHVYGRERFDTFLRRWFDEHAFQSVTTLTFRDFVQRELLWRDPALLPNVDLERWITAAGLPADAAVPRARLFEQVDQALADLRAGTAAADLPTTGWVTQQWLRFLHGLDAGLAERIGEIDQAFGFTRSGNSEVLAAWLAYATRHGHAPADRRLELFLMTVGRRKFLKPLYEALLETPGGRDRALSIYRRARPRYHAVSQRTLDAMLGYEPSGS
jgi:leukotriene-A4 hydrolase